MEEFITEIFKNFSLTFCTKGKDFQIRFDSHTLHADEIIYASHTIFNLIKNNTYIGYLLMREEKEQLKQFLKKVNKL